MNREKLAVFDMDGTLYDTTDVNYLSYAEAASQLGYRIERQDFINNFVGRNYKDFLPEFGICNNEEQERIHEIKKKMYMEYLKYAKRNDSLFSLIESMRNDYIVALATTASRKNTIDILDYFGDTERFDFFITQEDTAALKPDPQCYLMAMMKAGIDAKNTIVFEDSDVGMLAAKLSGAYVLKVEI